MQSRIFTTEPNKPQKTQAECLSQALVRLSSEMKPASIRYFLLAFILGILGLGSQQSQVWA